MSKRYPGGIIRKTPQTPSQTSAQGIWDMASVTQAVKENTWPIAGVPDPISKSLRFRASASAYLNRTPTVASNRTTWTWSGWVKRGFGGGPNNFTLFFAESGGNTNARIEYLDSGQFRWFYQISGVDTAYTLSNALYRDYSAWYHVVYVYDSTQATAANRQILYVNGVQTTNSAVLTPAQNTVTSINDTVTHWLGRNNSPQYFDGYLADVNFIDGQALTPSSFGNTNDQTGVWQPIAYTGTYGTNGFYLPFSNTASTTTLGNDFSGNSNNWTTNNISLTSGSTYDSMNDVPTQWIPYNTAGDTGALWRGNYCTWNPNSKGSLMTVTGGNLNASTSANGSQQAPEVGGTVAVSSGKWYWELTITASDGGRTYVGVGDGTRTGNNYGQNGYEGNTGYGQSTGTYGYFGSNGNRYQGDGSTWTNTTSAYGNTYTTNDVIGVALDLDNGKIWFSKNGTWQASGDPAAGTNAAFTSVSGLKTPLWKAYCDTSPPSSCAGNFGQRPFSYTPPSGFKTLNTTNLPTPTIGATASTTANKYMDVTTYTGTGSTQSIVNSGAMQPDFVWTKQRSGTANNCLLDSVRGVSRVLFSDLTNAEANDPGYYVTAFNSNGFSVGLGSGSNGNGSTYVGWQWRASNTTAVTNTAGSITSTVSANTTAGFSIVTYTGTGASATVGHGLGVAPSMVILKSRSAVTDWRVYSAYLNGGVTPANYTLKLNTTNAEAADSTIWNNTVPTSTVFSIGSNVEINNSGNLYVAYCFAPIAGYSAFGSYTGNGSTDGPFVFLGFRPRFVMIKASSISSEHWYIVDATRSPYNAAILYLSPDDSDAETSPGAAQFFDFLSNGFKLRVSGSYSNSSGATYIYMAFAESPFKFSLAR
jgi:hypothetical protein